MSEPTSIRKSALEEAEPSRPAMPLSPPPWEGRALEALDPDLARLAMGMAADLWARAGISPRERTLIAVAACVLNQTLGASFTFQVTLALRHGVTRLDLRELVLHLAVYGAFPKALEAMSRLNQVFEEFDRQGLYQTGDALTFSVPEKNLLTEGDLGERLASMDQAFGKLAVRIAGEVWGRPGLSQKERAYLCLAANVCHQTLSGPFPLHLELAMKSGASAAQLREVLLYLAFHASFPKALEAIQALDRYLESTAPGSCEASSAEAH